MAFNKNSIPFLISLSLWNLFRVIHVIRCVLVCKKDDLALCNKLKLQFNCTQITNQRINKKNAQNITFISFIWRPNGDSTHKNSQEFQLNVEPYLEYTLLHTHEQIL